MTTRSTQALLVVRAPAFANSGLGSGTTRAEDDGMAAVFALIFVPTLAAVLFMLGGLDGSLSFSTGLATAVFVSLAIGILVGLFRLVHAWDGESPHG